MGGLLPLVDIERRQTSSDSRSSNNAFDVFFVWFVGGVG